MQRWGRVIERTSKISAFKESQKERERGERERERERECLPLTIR